MFSTYLKDCVPQLNYYLYNLVGKRYYDSDIGLCTSVDPCRQHWSGYTYGSNNPVNRVDPDGCRHAYNKEQFEEQLYLLNEADSGLKLPTTVDEFAEIQFSENGLEFSSESGSYLQFYMSNGGDIHLNREQSILISKTQVTTEYGNSDFGALLKARNGAKRGQVRGEEFVDTNGFIMFNFGPKELGRIFTDLKSDLWKGKAQDEAVRKMNPHYNKKTKATGIRG